MKATIDEMKEILKASRHNAWPVVETAAEHEGGEITTASLYARAKSKQDRSTGRAAAANGVDAKAGSGSLAGGQTKEDILCVAPRLLTTLIDHDHRCRLLNQIIDVYSWHHLLAPLSDTGH